MMRKGLFRAMRTATTAAFATAGLLVSTSVAETSAPAIKLPVTFYGGFVLKEKGQAWLMFCNVLEDGGFSEVSAESLLSYDNLESDHKVVRYTRSLRDRESRIRNRECPTGALAVVTSELWEAFKSQGGVLPQVISTDFQTTLDMGYRVSGFWSQQPVQNPPEKGDFGLITFFSLVFDVKLLISSTETTFEEAVTMAAPDVATPLSGEDVTIKELVIMAEAESIASGRGPWSTASGLEEIATDVAAPREEVAPSTVVVRESEEVAVDVTAPSIREAVPSTVVVRESGEEVSPPVVEESQGLIVADVAAPREEAVPSIAVASTSEEAVIDVVAPSIREASSVRRPIVEGEQSSLLRSGVQAAVYSPTPPSCINPFEGQEEELREAIRLASSRLAQEHRMALGKGADWEQAATRSYSRIAWGLAFIETGHGSNIGECGGLFWSKIEYAAYALALFGSEEFMNIPASVPAIAGHSGGAIGVFQMLAVTLWSDSGGADIQWKSGYHPFTERGSRARKIRRLQEYFNNHPNLEVNLTIDGRFGENTREAIKTWWMVHGSQSAYIPFFNSSLCEEEVRDGKFGRCIQILINQEHVQLDLERVPAVPNPFVLEDAAYAALTHLHSLSVKGDKGYLIYSQHDATVDENALTFAAGAYYAGFGGARTQVARNYASRLLRNM